MVKRRNSAHQSFQRGAPRRVPVDGRPVVKKVREAAAKP
jgi:hypothetical protein